MPTLVPRFFRDIGEWFDTELRPQPFAFRIEDRMTDDHYVVRAELPGLNPANDVTVTVDRGKLDIRAERREEAKTKHRSEFRYGLLRRAVRLPAGADEKETKARYNNGILEVTVPVHEAEPPAGRTVPIETSG